MATPEAEETVAPPATTEEVVKSAEGGEKGAPKAPADESVKDVEEEPKKVEEKKTAEEKEVVPPPANEDKRTTTETAPATEGSAEGATDDGPDTVPAEPFKEESNAVADLKAPETKALEELKARIVKAIEDNEFKVPKKVVDPPPSQEKAAETTPPAAAAEAPAAEKATTKTDTPAATETPATTEGSAAPPPSELKAEEGTPPAPAPSSATEVETPAEEKKEVPAEELKEKSPVAPEQPASEDPSSKAEAPPATESKAVETETKEPPTEEAPAPPPSSEEKVEEKTESKDAPATAAAPEHVSEDLTPPEDVALWGVPLLHTKGDPRTDIILLKFLRARDLNVSLAFEQLKKVIIWRKTFKADGLLEEDFGSDFDDVSFYYGKDKNGHPVCYNVYAPFHSSKEKYAKAFGDSTKLASFIRWRIMVVEKGIKLLNFSEEGPNSIVQINDVKYFPGVPGAKGKLRSAYSQAVNILQDNYPELVVKQVFVNAPWYFRPFYTFLSPFLSLRQKSKISIYTPARTLESLLKFIPGESLPIAYGGLSKPNDPEFDGVDAPAKDQVIEAGKKTDIEIPVSESSGTLVWDLVVGGYDVNYSAEYTSESYPIIIERSKKLPPTQQEPLRYSFEISKPGKVVISIENQTRKKKIALYRFTVKSSKSSSAPTLTPTSDPAPEVAAS